MKNSFALECVFKPQFAASPVNLASFFVLFPRRASARLGQITKKSTQISSRWLAKAGLKTHSKNLYSHSGSFSMHFPKEAALTDCRQGRFFCLHGIKNFLVISPFLVVNTNSKRRDAADAIFLHDMPVGILDELDEYGIPYVLVDWQSTSTFERSSVADRTPMDA